MQDTQPLNELIVPEVLKEKTLSPRRGPNLFKNTYPRWKDLPTKIEQSPELAEYNSKVNTRQVRRKAERGK